MSRQSFMKLCELMKTISPEEVTVRRAIPLAMRVAMVLYKLGSSAEYRLIANQFGVHKSTVKKFVYMFCKSMVQGPIKDLIRVPTEEEALYIASRFEASYHLPNVMGIIDGTHIPMLPPSDGYKDFVNRKGWPSYVLHAVVDHQFCFWNISCKMPGSAHDASVLRNSDLFQKAHLLPKGDKIIEGESIRLVIVGDPAYPLLPWLVKGHLSSPWLTPEQESFNVYLSSLRVGVENTFGILKARWRVLLKRSDFHFTFTPTVIATCFALHNFCQLQREHINWLEEAATPDGIYPQPAQPANVNEHGNHERAVVTGYMATHFPLRSGHLY